jgi:tripeptidyl-peptidase-1
LLVIRFDMNRFSILVVAAIVACSVIGCIAAPKGYTRMENREVVHPAGWTNIGRSSANKMIKLQLAIKQQNVDRLTSLLFEVSDRDHPSYGKYLTTEQIGQLVAPSDERIEKIASWLRSFGVSPAQCEMSLHKDFLTLSVSVKQAEALLATEFFDFVHSNGKLLSRATQYHVPENIAPELDFIGGVIRFPPAKEHGIHSMIQRTTGLSRDAEALPVGDSALLGYILVGDKEFTINFAPRCANGKPLTANSMQCPEGFLNAAEVTWSTSTGHHSATAALVLGLNVDAEESRCGAVSTWKGTVHTAQLSVVQKYGLSTNTIFCSVRVHGTENVPNYRTILNAKLVTIPLNANPSSALVLPAITPAPWVTPRRLQEYYRVPTGTINRYPGNSQSVSEFLDQYYAPADLTKFMSLMGLKDYKVDKVIGPNQPNNPGLEASLDIQYLLGMSHNVTTWFWSLGELHEGQEPFLQWLIDLSNTPKVPYVHSTSYADEEQSLTVDYMTRINTELVKAGVRGLTLLFSSGDDGVGGYTLRTNPTICEKRGFAPEFPSSSPYVTAVGGTQFSDRYLPVCDGNDVGSLQYTCDGVGEIVSSSATGSRITSGGGFSINWPRPAYQEEAVNDYLSYSDSHGLTPNKNLFNRNGRALPDISGMAHNYLTVIGDDLVPVDGTSASTPVTASFIALINDRLLSLGQPTIGFFNPILYQLGKTSPQAFTDVVVGDNSCSAMRDICCQQGFHAAPGWDAATGFGSPIFEKLVELLVRTP